MNELKMESGKLKMMLTHEIIFDFPLSITCQRFQRRAAP